MLCATLRSQALAFGAQSRFNFSGFNSQSLGALTLAFVFGFDTLRLAAGLFVQDCGMNLTRFWGLALILLLVACSAKPDPTIILGNWRAESFTIDSLKLPIAPSFEVTRNDLILKSPKPAEPEPNRAYDSRLN